MKNTPQFDVSVVGELNLDLVLYGLPERFELDHEHLASDLRLTLGSSSAIFAHNLALLGSRVSFHSVVGDDSFGDSCVTRLAESGTDVSAVRKWRGRLTGLTVIIPQPQKRFILTYPGVMAEMRFEDLDLNRVLDARHLHLSSYFLQRALRPAIPALFRLAKEAGLSTSLDTNDDPDDVWDSEVSKTFEWVDVLLLNEREACRMTRTDDPLRAAEILSKKVSVTVMKRGETGVLARAGTQIVEALPPKTNVVDTIGAGDSFDAGFLHQFIRGAKLADCLRFGNLAGALSTTRPGGIEAFRDAVHREAFFSRY